MCIRWSHYYKPFCFHYFSHFNCIYGCWIGFNGFKEKITGKFVIYETVYNTISVTVIMSSVVVWTHILSLISAAAVQGLIAAIKYTVRKRNRHPLSRFYSKLANSVCIRYNIQPVFAVLHISCGNSSRWAVFLTICAATGEKCTIFILKNSFYSTAVNPKWRECVLRVPKSGLWHWHVEVTFLYLNCCSATTVFRHTNAY